jgi:hypothetical protein
MVRLAGRVPPWPTITTIYDAILDPHGWDEAVKRTVDATKSVAGFLAVRREYAGNLLATCNADRFYTDLFARHYYKTNPLNAAGAAIPPGKVRSVTSITQYTLEDRNQPPGRIYLPLLRDGLPKLAYRHLSVKEFYPTQ